MNALWEWRITSGHGSAPPGLASARPELKGTLYVQPVSPIYGEIANDTKITITLFSSKSHETLETIWEGKDVPRLERGIPFSEISPKAGSSWEETSAILP